MQPQCGERNLQRYSPLILRVVHPNLDPDSQNHTHTHTERERERERERGRGISYQITDKASFFGFSGCLAVPCIIFFHHVYGLYFDSFYKAAYFFILFYVCFVSSRSLSSTRSEVFFMLFGFSSFSLPNFSAVIGMVRWQIKWIISFLLYKWVVLSLDRCIVRLQNLQLQLKKKK